MKSKTIQSIRVKLVNQKGETVVREDGDPMIFILVDEARLHDSLKTLEHWPGKKCCKSNLRDYIEELLE